MKNLFSVFVLITLILFSSNEQKAQAVYLPVNHGVHQFLERCELKGLINFHNEVLPLTRRNAAELLAKVEKNFSFLNSVEQEELKWYLSEFAHELNRSDERWFLYEYTDSLFSFRVSPVIGYGVSRIDGKSGHIRWPGLKVYGEAADWFAAGFEYKDTGEFGDNIDKQKKFSPETGHWYKNVSNGIEYSDVRGSINFNWAWGSVSLIKDYMTWGHGKFGQLILSEKAASFPHIRLVMQPAEWIRFYYMHGWLNSLVYDSSAFYYNNTSSSKPFLRKDYVNKYIAANMLSLTPFKWLDFSLGNSFIYSGAVRPEMFIPFMYFKVMDHNTGRGNIGDGNGQIFFDTAIKYFDEFVFYSTAFIDVIEIREILKNNWSTSWIGYTFGGKKIDFFLHNLDLTLEYTRINPWLYEHKDETTTYKHINYTLGHWIGQNADQFRIQFDYQLIRGLKFELYFESIRKGGMDDIALAYDSKSTEEFLYGRLTKYKSGGVSVNYEFMHDLFFSFKFRYEDIKRQISGTLINNSHEVKRSLSLKVFYGL